MSTPEQFGNLQLFSKMTEDLTIRAKDLLDAIHIDASDVDIGLDSGDAIATSGIPLIIQPREMGSLSSNEETVVADIENGFYEVS